MKPLKLYLTPIDAARFKVIITDTPQGGEGETESNLLSGGYDWRITVLKALEVSNFQSKDFQRKGEQDWMMQFGLLAEERAAFHPDMHANIGRLLYQTLFPNSPEMRRVEHLLQGAIRFAESSSAQLHVQIIIQADVAQHARLSDYPWELLHDDRGFLAQRQVGFSRYIAYEAARPNLPSVDKVNVLLVSSAAYDRVRGLGPLLSQERQAVHTGLDKAQREGHIRLIELKPATRAALRAYLTEHRGDDAPRIIHFDGHGFFGKHCKQCRTMHSGITADRCSCGASLGGPQGYLVFEDGASGADYVSAKELHSLLPQASFSDDTGQQRGVALLVLSACQSGLSLGGDSVFNGIAQSLIDHQIPAVVAMQFSVRVDSASAFAEQFYRCLGQRDSLVGAVSSGREAMGSEGNQWYRPVLYLRWQDNEGGQMFSPSQMDVDRIRLKGPQCPLQSIPPSWAGMQDVRVPVPHMVGSLPRFYVQRASLHSKIKSLIINDNSNANQSPTLSLLGAGGFGKTTLVRAICSDTEVIEHFSHGILWVTLGENRTNISEKLSGVINSLTNLHTDFDSLEIAAKRMRELLSERKCLLVLDDVWNIADIEPFLGDDKCTRIIITRGIVIAAQADNSPILINEMQIEEAVQVLLNHVPKKFQQDETLLLYLQGMAMKLGKWPLLLDLFGMTLRQEIQQGNSLQKAIEYINEGLHEEGFIAFDSSNPEHRNQALAVSMNVSLRAYNLSDKNRLYELSIFPRNLAIPEHVVLRLWSGTSKLSRFEGRKLLRRFAGHFFQMYAQELSGELHIFFHDAMREYLTRQMDIEEWQQAHDKFLRDYNPTYAGKWWEIQDDGYLYHNLIYHLINAGREKELLDLLVGSPDWQNEKFAQFGSNQSFIIDLEQAIQVFEQKDTMTSLIRLVELYAALQVVFTRIEMYTDDDLRTLVSLGKIEQALNYARLRSDTGSMFNGLVAIYETLVVTIPEHTAHPYQKRTG